MASSAKTTKASEQSSLSHKLNDEESNTEFNNDSDIESSTASDGESAAESSTQSNDAVAQQF